MIFRMNTYGQFLGTRSAGRNFRIYLDHLLDSDEEQIVFDFTGVVLVTNSFADESFGKTVEKIGIDKLRERTTFKNLDNDSAAIVSRAIKQRALSY